MTILRRPVAMVRLTWQCDECHKGEMIAKSGTSNLLGTLWLHRCNSCGHEATAEHSYPYLDYEFSK